MVLNGYYNPFARKVPPTYYYKKIVENLWTDPVKSVEIYLAYISREVELISRAIKSLSEGNYGR